MQYCIILNKLSRMWTHRCTPGVLVFVDVVVALLNAAALVVDASARSRCRVLAVVVAVVVSIIIATVV